MCNETGILKQGVETIAIQRGRIETNEGIGREQDECQERSADQPLNRKCSCKQRLRQVLPEHRDSAAKDAEDQHPKQHRTLVVPPDTGDLVGERLVRMRIHRNKLNREVGHDECHGQADEGSTQENKLPHCCALRDGHEPRMPFHSAIVGYGRLNQRKHKRKDQCKVANLGDHLPAPARWAFRI